MGEKAAAISVAITSAINLATLSLSESSSRVVSAISPMMQLAIECGLSAIGPNRLSEREKYRVGSAVWWASKVAEDNIRAGRSVSQQQFEQDDLTALVESLFRAASEDSQEKKDMAYGAFLGNFAFQDQFDGGALFAMARILKDLSFDELLLMASLDGRPGMNYESFYKKLDQEGDLRCGEMIGYFVRLRNLGLTVRVVPITLGSNIGNLKLSALGEALCHMAMLDDLDPEQLESLRGYLDLFAKPIGF